MYDITGARHANQREVGAMIDRARDLPAVQWATPVLPGWTVLDLLDHVGRALVQQADAFDRGRRGELVPPPFPHPRPTTPALAIVALEAGVSRMQEALGALEPAHLESLTPMPFAVIPTALALQIAVIEYGMHRWDLERATGDAGYDLPDDVAAAALGIMPGLLPMLSAGASERPPAPLAIQLVCAVPMPALVYDGQEWAAGACGQQPVTEVRGSASDITMFCIGRLDASSPGVEVCGPAEPAQRFKAYFPGP